MANYPPSWYVCNSLILEIFAEIDREYFRYFIVEWFSHIYLFLDSNFSCIIAKRAGFTAVPIEAFPKKLISSFPNVEEFIW